VAADIIPTLKMFRIADATFATTNFRRFFQAQPPSTHPSAARLSRLRHLCQSWPA
jgi:hypothetical protein